MRAAAVIGVFGAALLSACGRRTASAIPDAGAAVSSKQPAATSPAAASPAAPSSSVVAAPASRSVRMDSVRGVVSRIGNEPRAHWVVRAGDGSSCLLRWTETAPAPSLDGLEVTLWGFRSTGAQPGMPGTPCAFDAARFAVRAADGIMAVDGVLRASGARFELERSDGARVTLRVVPVPMREWVGARVFWAGPLDRAPAAYGLIVRAKRGSRETLRTR